jgi:hypothetical protein
MSTTLTVDGLKEINTDRDLEQLGIAKRQTLAVWRSRGVGPAYVKSGASVKYLRADVLAFIASNRVDPSTPATARKGR